MQNFINDHKPESIKEKLWTQLVYLMRSPDFNYSDHHERVEALELHKDITGLIDALHVLKKGDRLFIH